MNHNIKSIITSIVGTKHYDFKVPKVGDKTILVHNPKNKVDRNAIMVVNKDLEQMGHLSTFNGFNNEIGQLMNWEPYIATVKSVYEEKDGILIIIEIQK
jgi:hypothetical protein